MKGLFRVLFAEVMIAAVALPLIYGPWWLAVVLPGAIQVGACFGVWAERLDAERG